MATKVRILSFVLLFGIGAGSAQAQIQAQIVGTGFSQPLFAASAPGDAGTLYVVQKGGAILPLNPQTGAVGSALLNLSTVSGAGLITGGEGGLLGLAFHPDFQNNGLMYVNYTYNNGQTGGALRVEQYQVTGGVADPVSRQTVIEIAHPNNTNHYGGWIGFNPMNGTSGGNSGQLFIMTGDGGGSNDPANNAQNLDVLLGKTLRLDVGSGLTAANPNYAIPTGNMSGTNVQPEIYSYGLRNPFRSSFDRQTGNLYIGDVGQSAREEINFIANGSAGGQNFGWRLREGTIQNPAAGIGGPRPADNVEPIHDYVRSLGGSVTGGYVYRGPALDDSGQPLDGHYIFGDYVSGRIFSFEYNGSFVTTAVDRTTELGFAAGDINVSSFAEDGHGNLYVIDYAGTVYQIIPVPEPAMIGLVLVGAMAVGMSLKRRMKKRRASVDALASR
jgi:glucose/arabinose dehydrogenase